LIDAINYMYENKKYSRMVFYIEACESGSMFYNKLKKNIDGMLIYCFLIYTCVAINKKFLTS